MAAIRSRFEFRTFAQNFGLVIEKMRGLSPCEGIRESDEIYIMAAANNENNTKIRDNKMDIKVFVTEKEGLQQWSPRIKGEFPMTTAMIRDDVFSAFGVSLPDFYRETYTLSQYLAEIIAPHPELSAVNVFKRRFAFTVNHTIVESAELLINGAAIQTVAVESTEITDILETKNILGLNGYENVNYLLAIKRIIGWAPLPN